MQINYDNAKLVSKTVRFDGVTESGKSFSIMANWNDWDDWNVTSDEITWEDEAGTDEEIEMIIEEFTKTMNG